MSELFTARWVNENNGVRYAVENVIHSEVRGGAITLVLEGQSCRIVPLSHLATSMVLTPMEAKDE